MNELRFTGADAFTEAELRSAAGFVPGTESTLLQLQTVLSPSVLTSLEVDEGSVQIEGESSDPQSLLQRLEQDSMFTGVDFARATNNNRYYIDLRLSTVDFDGYRQRYFPEVRR